MHRLDETLVGCMLKNCQYWKFYFVFSPEAQYIAIPAETNIWLIKIIPMLGFA